MQRSTKSWLDHELVSKHIFEAILKQEKVQNLDVRHNVIIAGKSTKHQIDLYWKFTAASVAYSTVVQVKKEKRKVSKGDMFTFKGVLDDIPGRPKGLFISQRGYQKGALEVAKSYDIIPYELTEIAEKPHLVLTIFSVASVIVRPEILSWEWTAYYTTCDDITLSLDAKWAHERNIALPGKCEQPTTIDQIQFSTMSRTGIITFQNLIQQIVKQHRKAFHGKLTFTVTEPMEPMMILGIPFITEDGIRLDSVAIVYF